MTQFLSELLQGIVDMVFDGRNRDAQPFADLTVRKSFDMAHAEHFAALGRQRLDRRVDLAMLPLDSRLKTGGYLGPNYFLNLMEVRRFLPMHQWEDFAFTDEFLSAYPQFAPITVKIHRDGEFLGEL